MDTNIILRYLTWDDPKKARRCEALFQRVAEGKETLRTSTLVIAEVVWTLQKAYKVPRAKIADLVGKILNTPNIEVDEKDLLVAAVGLYEFGKIDFIDAYHAMYLHDHGLGQIYSNDHDFDSILSLS